MTDDPKYLDRILTSDEEEAVRRQLAAARHTEPMPADVAGRLDDVLAGLQAARAKQPEGTAAPESNVVPLASRRRHRIAQGVVAAAAVVAVGVGVTQVLGNVSTSSDDSGGDAPAVASRDDAADSGSATREQAPNESSPSADYQLDGALTKAYATAPAVRSASFQRDVARLAPFQRTAAESERSLLRLTDQCGPTSPPAGHDALRVRYDDQPAILAFRAPVDGKQRVDLYLCATGARERSATIDQP